MNVLPPNYSVSLGSLLALIALVLVVVMFASGQVPLLLGIVLVLLALSRLT